MRVVVLDSFAADQGEAAWAELQALGDVVLHPRTEPALVAARCADAEAIVTNKVVLSGAAIEALPALRYIGVSATGTNVVDLPAAAGRGVAVTNVPGYSTASVAQLVFALVLELTTDVAGHDRDVKGGRWASSPDFCFFRRPLAELAGKTLLVIGFGAIGRAVGRIAEAFGMRVVAGAVPGSPTAGRVPLDEALPDADVVSLHCPLTASTERLVDARFLARLKRTAILVNTSRGGLVDERALADALAQNRIGGAALDVLGAEPPPQGHLLASLATPRLIVTPHIGWGTVEARARLRREVAANLAAFLAGERRNRVA